MVIAIVAIPSPDNYVWQLSSEKIPHLTMLTLGDSLKNPGRVGEFIKHVADSSMERFVLDVERRSVLGDKSADVLFFGKLGIDHLENVRGYLLGDPDIRDAYDTIEQFPQWTPHLTLGYPESPAKTDNREYPGIYSVAFDRIALWTGEYEGVEFPLKTSTELAQSTSERGRAFLKHYGVKGMHWGIRKDKAAAVVSDLAKTKVRNVKDAKEYIKPSSDAKTAESLRVKTRVAGVQTLSNKELQDVIMRMNLERQFKELKKVEFEDSYTVQGAKWAGKFANDVLKDVTVSWLKRPGSSTPPRTRGDATAYTWGQQVGGAIETHHRRAIGS